MAWTPFGANKGAGDTISAADLNTSLRDNLLALKAHYDADSAHGMDAANHLMGFQSPHYHIEGQRSGAVTGGPISVTWDTAFASAPIVLHTMEYISGDVDLVWVCLSDVTTTGCTLEFSTVSGSSVWRGHVIAIGSDS
jgi:hypothetical protein